MSLDDDIRELKQIHKKIRGDIEKRLKEFKHLIKTASEKRLFAELVFCILTPQSKAETCWNSVEKMLKDDLLTKADINTENFKDYLHNIRFKNKKAHYILQAKAFFTEDGKLNVRKKIFQQNLDDIYKKREYLVKNIKGIGFKEASHFLRNIGLDEDKIAILDRHILRSLLKLRIITTIPTTLSKSRYLTIEKSFIKFSKEIDIPLSHLDFVFWYKETGRIFK